MPGQWWSFSHCPEINHTHIELNKEALSVLSQDELKLLYNGLFSLNASMGQCIKWQFSNTWHIFVAIYALVGLVGAFGNIYMIAIMFMETSFRRCINFLLFNLCLSNLVKSLVVLPVSLYVLLTAHWRLGSFMCYASPIAQTFPVVVTVITYLLAAMDRYLLLFHPRSSTRPPSRRMFMFLILATWAIGFCFCLPLKTCVQYYNLNTYFGEAMKGYGLCAIGFDARIREINIALFMVIYAIPLLLMVYLLLKSNGELKSRLKSDTQALQDASQISAQKQALRREGSGRSRSAQPENRPAESDQFLTPAYSRPPSPNPGGSGRRKQRVGRTQSFLAYVDQEISQLSLLLKVNKCLGTMLALFAVCWAPLHCVMLVCYIIPESPDTVGVVDTLFLVCTLIGLLSTITNPALLIYQRKSVQAALHTGLRALRRLSSSAIGGLARWPSREQNAREDASVYD